MTLQHGTLTAYVNSKCRCMKCKVAHAEYHRDWRRRSGYEENKSAARLRQFFARRRIEYLTEIQCQPQ